MGNHVAAARPRDLEAAAAAHPLLSLRGVTKEYSSGETAIRVLDGIDLNIDGGEFVAIKGPSGAGKSTLLHIAAGLSDPSSGRVAFDGRSLDELSKREFVQVRRERFGFVFQFFNLVPGLDVQDNVALPLLFGGVKRRQAAERAAELIEAVGLQHRARHATGLLSGGEMQRTAVARALAARPQVVFADEPTGNLDSHNGEKILDLLTKLCSDHGTALMMVTHDEDIARRADRVVEVRDGQIASNTPASGATAPAADRESR